MCQSKLLRIRWADNFRNEEVWRSYQLWVKLKEYVGNELVKVTRSHKKASQARLKIKGKSLWNTM